MQVEDHPVSYFDFEGTIPEGNYGAGTVMVWDMGTWEPLGDASEMLKRVTVKFRLDGQKLKGEFALADMKSRRPGSKGTEWLLIKHRDAYVQQGYNIDKYDYSVLTKRSMPEIAGDAGSAQWESSRAATARGSSGKNDWLADSIAKADAKKAKSTSNKSAKKVAVSTGSSSPAATQSVAKRAAAKASKTVSVSRSVKKKLVPAKPAAKR